MMGATKGVDTGSVSQALPFRPGLTYGHLGRFQCARSFPAYAFGTVEFKLRHGHGSFRVDDRAPQVG